MKCHPLHHALIWDLNIFILSILTSKIEILPILFTLIRYRISFPNHPSSRLRPKSQISDLSIFWDPPSSPVSCCPNLPSFYCCHHSWQSHTYATSRSCMPLDVSPWAGTKDLSTGRLEGDAIGDGGFSCLISPASSWFVPSIVTWSCWSQLNFPFWVYSGILWSNLRIISENDRRWRKGDSFDGRWAIGHPNLSRVAKQHCVWRSSTNLVRSRYEKNFVVD